MLPFISKSLLIATLFLSTNMLVMPQVELLGVDAEVLAVGGSSGGGGVLKKVLRCQLSGNCLACVPFTDCGVYPYVPPGTFDPNEEPACHCASGHSGCSFPMPSDVCKLVCAEDNQVCAPKVNLSCGFLHEAVMTIVNGICEPGQCVWRLDYCRDCN